MLRFDNVVLNDYQCRCELLQDCNELACLFCNSLGFQCQCQSRIFSAAKTA